jgi:uncharacterized protein
VTRTQVVASGETAALCGQRVSIRRFFRISHWMKNVLAPAATVEGSQPQAHGLIAQAVRIPAARGLSLFAWFVPALKTGPQPTVVLLHGWCGNASNLLPAAQALHQAGFAVLLIESRNHGRSDRDDHSSLPRFAEDLDSAIDWLTTLPQVDTTRIVALGHSVGAAAVLLSASRRHDLAAVVSIAAFAHPEQLMRHWFAVRYVPYWPVAWLINRALERVIGASFDAIAPVNTVLNATCPVLLVHGRQDSVVPVTDAHRIWKRGNGANVRLIECDGTHERLDDAEGVTRDILEFFESAMSHRCASTSLSA